MMELIQFPWSNYCLVQRRILEFGGIAHHLVNIPPSDRSLVWRLSRQRYYAVPLLRDGRTVVFETDENSQVIAKYIESRFNLGLFPAQWDGLQRILWRYIEHDVEDRSFRLNDARYKEFVPPKEQLAYLRHKERRYGRGCLDAWLANQKTLLAELTAVLLPFEQMLGTRRFLLDERPRFVDFDLWGMLANFLYSGRYRLPQVYPKIKAWYGRMSQMTIADVTK